jgi:ubiquinone/menaquinone biosynthesis C-methylase UbiE
MTRIGRGEVRRKPMSCGISIFSSLKNRRREEEWMDGEGVEEEELANALKFIRRINRLLGYTRTTVRHLEELSRNWRKGERVEILDVATGSGDIPVAVLEWAESNGFDVRVVGVDRHEKTVGIAARVGASCEFARTDRDAKAGEALDRSTRPHPTSPEGRGAGQRAERFSVVRADALRLPFESGSFDYCLTAMFLHHLDDEAVVQVLGEMNRVARRGVIVADLLRHRRALVCIKLLTLFSNPMVKHDAAVSVGQAFRKAEVKDLGDRAGLGFATYRRHFGHRFVLAGEKMGNER